MLPFGLTEGDKFALIAIENCYSVVRGPMDLPDGTTVTNEFPSVLHKQWKCWLGDFAVEHLRRCNLVIIPKATSTKPELLDAEHQQLYEHVTSLFWLLQLSGVPEYGGAFGLKGSAHGGRVYVRAYSEVNDFYCSEGATKAPITPQRLVEAASMKDQWHSLLAQPLQFKRFKKGLNVLVKGLQESTGQERLHQFVRALEALILPKPGETKRQFINRCQTFAVRNPSTDAILAEAFDMRSDVEHLHAWDRSLTNYPRKERESVAWQRTKQVEQLASQAYRRLLVNQNIIVNFQDDVTIAQYWNLPESKRLQIWGKQLNLTRVK